MKTRQQYLKNECTHSEYYGDFINPAVISIVNSWFTKSELTTALNVGKHLNSIPLHVWDSIGRTLCNMPLGLFAMCKEKGDTLTQSGLVCIAKEAARQIVNAD